MVAPDDPAELIAAETDAAAAPNAGDIRVKGSVVGSALVTGVGHTVNVVTIVYAAELLRQRMAEPALGANPYRGLDAFDETSATLFFGRETVVAGLMARLERATAPVASSGGTRLLAVVGPSGCGKSSVVLAGLLPALARTDSPWLRDALVVVLRPRHAPVESLADALARTPRGETLPDARRRTLAADLRDAARSGRHDALRRVLGEIVPEGRPLLLVVDQFEETYTLCRPDDPADARQREAARAERETFVGALMSAASEPDARVTVLLTLRSDFYGSLAEHPALSAAVSWAHVLVPAMQPDELRRAIAEPARAAGCSLPRHTVDRLLSDTAIGGAAALPLLSFALSRLWEAMRDGGDPDTALALMNGVGGALAQRADAVLHDLPAAWQRLARDAFLATVQLGENGRDTNRRVALDEALPAGTTPEQARAALDPFVSARLLVSDATPDGRIWIELPHEALIPHWATLRFWIDAERDDLRLERRAQTAAAAWDGAGRPSGSLWRRPDLDRLRQLSGRRGLPALVAAFLAASVRRHRVMRRAIWAFAAAFALLFVGGGFAIYTARQSGIAEAKLAALNAQLNASNSQLTGARAALAATALSTLSEQATGRGDAMTGMLLALSAAAEPGARDIPAARAALLDAWLSNREVAVLRGGRGAVIGAAFAEGGSHVRVATFDGTLADWDVSGLPAAAPAGSALDESLSGNIAAFAEEVSADGSRAALVASDGRAHVFGLAGHIVTIPSSSGRPIQQLAFSADGQLLATAAQDGSLAVWRVAAQVRQPIIERHLGPVARIALSTDGQTLAAAYPEGSVRLWRLASPAAPPTTLRCQPGRFSTLQFAPDDQIILTLSGNGLAQVWDLAGPEPVARTLVAPAINASFSPDGQRIVIASYDRIARVWDLADPSRPPIVLAGHTAGLSSARFSPDGTRVVTAAHDGTARVWNVSGQPSGAAMVLAGHVAADIYDADFSPDGTRVLTVAGDNTTRVWDVSGERPRAAAFSGGTGRHSAAFSSRSPRVAISMPDGSVEIHDLSEPGQPVVAAIPGRGEAVILTALSPDGRALMTAASGGAISIWNVAKAQPQLLGMVRPVVDGWIESATFSQDGKRLLTTWTDARARIWTLNSLGEPVVLAGRYGPCCSSPMQAAFSPDGTSVLTAWPSYASWLWNISGALPRSEVLAESEMLNTATFSPDGRQIVIGRLDGITQVWQRAREQLKLSEVLAGNGASVSKAVFAANSQRVATQADNGEVRIWTLNAGTPGATILDSPDNSIQDFDVSPDGSRLAIGSAAGSARLWDVSGHSPAASLLIPPGQHLMPVDQAAFSADGAHVITTEADGVVRVFDTPPIGELEADARRALTRCLTVAQREAAGLPVAASVVADRNAVPPPPCDAPAATP